ncbi:hypothetical protein [Phytomonospora endophytica]|uniref:Uncharacterized protein n=1 Tax=Phytomonospora endophytica TaxID=714109 RepID=A0A841FEG3_9ACTN|nr:hypothetical protein [Phytomonospora endophytica]MBB6033925.1 hypothetical protein [Phytomonospora endophytica]GIG64554.1 hypothetical protein Pen01_08490 [Phytomonospora endophytica]
MSLAPAAGLTLADLRYDAQLATVSVTLGLLPEVNRCRAVLPASVRFEAVPGDPGEVSLTGLELTGGAAEETVLTGTVHRVRRDSRWIHVDLTDASGALAAARPAAGYTGTTATDVVTALLGEASATPGELRIDLPLAGYVADQARTAAEHLARLAALAGCVGTVAGDGPVSVAPPAASAETALRHGRDLLTYRVTEHGPPTTRTVPVGAGPASPEELRPSPDFLPADAPEAAADVQRHAEPVLRVPSAASTASDAAESSASRRSRRLYARCVLLPSLRPGTVVEIAESPGGVLDGSWLLTRVTHRITAGRPSGTEIDGTAAS